MSVYTRTEENVNCAQLTTQINANATITTNCLGATHHEPDTLLIEFSAAISAAEETELDTVVIPGHTPA